MTRGEVASPAIPTPGDQLPSVRKEMHAVLMRSRAWGGRNPIHWDASQARDQGFERPIATGQMISAHLSEMCVDYFGFSFFAGAKIERKYVKPVFAGDVVTTHGVVRDVRSVDGRLRVFVDIWAENQHGERVVVGTAEAWWD